MEKKEIKASTEQLQELQAENEQLREQLEEAQSVLRAIRYDQVDALIVAKPQGNAVYTLKGANRTYRILIETINEGTVILSDDGTILFCNSRFLEMVKSSGLTVTGTSMLNLIAPGEKRLFDALLKQGIKETARGETRLKAKDGTIVPVYLSVNSLQMENMQGACLIATDLTEQKRSEEIVAAGKLARAILDQTAQTIVVCDEDGRIIQTSRMAHMLCEKNPIFNPFDAVFSLVFNPQGNEADREAEKSEEIFSISSVLSGESFSGIEVGLKNRHENHHLLLNAGPLFSTRDQIIGAVVTLTDITELCHAREALRAAHDELEVKIQERTAELVRINRELQDFAFIASHDLQEPLRKIQTFGDRLKEKASASLNDECIDYLTRMQKSSKRMRTLIDDLLAYSRVGTRGQAFSWVSLPDVIQRVLSDLEVLIEQTGGIVEIEELPTLEADSTQMRQLFQNLIVNALKFHGEKKPVIKVHGQAHEGKWRIFIEDNGIGFGKENADRIFSPFQRLHGRSAYEGTGMGLAICRRIVERHGGSITAKSSPGKGSTFIVTLPVKQE